MITPTSAYKGQAADLVVIDTGVDPTPGIGRSVPGKQYLFPQTERLDPVRGIRVLCSLVTAPKYWPEQIGVIVPPTRPVASIKDIADWTITLREPDGSYIAKDMPLYLLAEVNNANKILRPMHYFGKLALIDPRQSFIRTASFAAAWRTFLFSYVY